MGYKNCYPGNPQPSFLGIITHILGVENLHFSWFWGPRVGGGFKYLFNFHPENWGNDPI